MFAHHYVASGQPFFTSDVFRGAFGTIDWTQGWCNWNPRNTSYPAGAVTVQGNITANTTWTAGNVYLLKGYVYVKNGATLTIQPGTIIRCDGATTSTLIITRGSKIIADGTPGSPIVFTSSEAAGSRNYGDWGGLVILGRGLVNTSGGVADVGAGINNAGGDGLYGGNDNNDSSGVLRFVRLEFGGIQYSPDKEINGLTLAGVGRKTVLENIQVSFCGADAFRFLGGAAQAHNLAAHRTLDADFSMELGYTGLIQYALALRDSTKASSMGCSSIEIQNDGIASAALPYTDPTLSNFTLVGPMTRLNTAYSSGFRNGIHLRRNARLGLFNSVITGFPRGMMFDGPGTGQQINDGKIIIRNSIIAGSKLKQADTTGRISAVLPGFDALSWIKEPNNANSTLTLPRDIGLSNPYLYNNPQFLPQSGSVLLNGADFSHPRLSATAGLEHLTGNEAVSALQRQGMITIRAGRPVTGEVQLSCYDLSGRKLVDLQLAGLIGEFTFSLPDPQRFVIIMLIPESGKPMVVRPSISAD